MLKKLRSWQFFYEIVKVTSPFPFSFMHQPRAVEGFNFKQNSQIIYPSYLLIHKIHFY